MYTLRTVKPISEGAKDDNSPPDAKNRNREIVLGRVYQLSDHIAEREVSGEVLESLLRRKGEQEGIVEVGKFADDRALHFQESEKKCILYLQVNSEG